MANRHRGEVAARLNGRDVTLCLTLGALAELETTFGDADMLALAQRFDKGRMSATDAQRIIGAGLRGAGHDVSNDNVAAMQADGGAAGFVSIVADLLRATFANSDKDGDAPSSQPSCETSSAAAQGAKIGEAHSDGPFPGTT